jgi:hypothetical protein
LERVPRRGEGPRKGPIKANVPPQHPHNSTCNGYEHRGVEYAAAALPTVAGKGHGVAAVRGGPVARGRLHGHARSATEGDRNWRWMKEVNYAASKRDAGGNGAKHCDENTIERTSNLKSST